MIKPEVLKTVLKGLAKFADDERKKSKPYKDMFSNHGDSIEGLLRKAEHEMMGVALNAMAVLREKYKINKISPEIWMLLTGLPLFADSLEKEIKGKEGIGCCVDKTYYTLSKMIIGQLKKDE